MGTAGWKQDAIVRRMLIILSLLITCTPQLLHIMDDRHMKDREAKDQNCCHWSDDFPLPNGCSMHCNKHTQYLNVKLGMGVKEKAHRIMWYALYGPPQSESKNNARHICSNKGGRCINPYHLIWDTVVANNLDVNMLRRERAKLAFTLMQDQLQEKLERERESTSY